MKRVFLIMIASWMLISASSAERPNPPIDPAKIIADKGVLYLSDGSSQYRFMKNHDFLLERAEGVQSRGREVEGKWVRDKQGQFVIYGKWQWDGGFQEEDDYRRMILWIDGITGEQLAHRDPQIPVMKSYIVVEEVVRVDKKQCLDEMHKCETESAK